MGVYHGEGLCTVMGQCELNQKIQNSLHSPPTFPALPEKNNSHQMGPLSSPDIIYKDLPHPPSS